MKSLHRTCRYFLFSDMISFTFKHKCIRKPSSSCNRREKTKGSKGFHLLCLSAEVWLLWHNMLHNKNNTKPITPEPKRIEQEHKQRPEVSFYWASEVSSSAVESEPHFKLATDFISALSVNTSHSLVFKQNRVFHKSYLFWYLDKCLTQKKMHENAWCWRNSEGVRHAQGNENCLCQFNQFLLLLHFIILSINLLLLGVKWVQITHVSGQVCLC